MAKFTNRVKLAWLKSMEVIGTSASNMADNAKHRLAEINLETRKREVMTEFNLKAFELWQNGTPLPAPLDELLSELADVDERLNTLRAQRYAKVSAKQEDAASAEPANIESASPTDAEPAPQLPDPGTGANESEN